MGVKSKVYRGGQAVVDDDRVALVIDTEFTGDLKEDLTNVRYVVYFVEDGEMSTVEHGEVSKVDGDDLESLLPT